jgi:hypothetical protein
MTPQRIARLLPAVFRHSIQPGQLLDGLLHTMADLHRPCEEALGTLERTCDPRRAPERFLPFLASWMRFDALCERAAHPGSASGSATGSHPGTVPHSWPGAGAGGDHEGKVESLGQLRELIADGAQLAHTRGTATGVRRFLEAATGISGFTIDDQVREVDGTPRAFHVRITAPAAARRQHDLILKVLRMAKPVHVTCDLHYA